MADRFDGLDNDIENMRFELAALMDGLERNDGGDAFWGSRFFRERYEWFVRELGFSPRDNASMETGFLFG